MSTPSITVESPANGDVWKPGETHVIKWTAAGSMDPKASILVYYLDSDFAPSSHNRTWQYLPVGKVPTTAGSAMWSIGLASWCLRGPVKLRVQTDDGAVHGDSALFSIGSPSITVTQPTASTTWIPHKPCTVAWEISEFSYCGPLPGMDPTAVNISLIRVGAPPPGEASKILLEKKVAGGSYVGIVGNLTTGDYFIRVQHCDNPLLQGDSPQFHVESVLGPDVGFLEPEAALGAGLVLEKVFFDGIDVGKLTARVRNMGDPYTGPLTMEYTLGAPTYPPVGPFPGPYRGIDDTASWADGTPHEVQIPGGVDIGQYETRDIAFLDWQGFSLTKTAHPSAPIPKSGPVFATVQITVPQAIGTDPRNRTFKGIVAKTPKPDIVAEHYIGFFWGGVAMVGRILAPDWKPASLWMYRWTKATLHEPDLPWIANTDSFVAGVWVTLANYGGEEKEFDCVLSVDRRPAQVLGKVTLRPGERRSYQWNATITLTQRFGLHEVVFIADPGEFKSEPYPSAYDNNFIYVVWEMVGGGTIFGHV